MQILREYFKCHFYTVCSFRELEVVETYLENCVYVYTIILPTIDSDFC